MTTEELHEKINLGEDVDTEFKSAKGGLPKSLWESLSGFANTSGGYIILGVDELSHEEFSIAGIKNPKGMLKIFWDNHNNSQKLSTPVCGETDVEILDVDGQSVLIIYVPETNRHQRPVFINGNPYMGTYKRNFEGDYRCSKSEVRQMLRDASDDAQDFDIIENFGLEDTDEETLKAYRNRFRSRMADHPYLALDDKEFLSRLGAYRKDRKTKQEGLTVAGLLMFGKETSIAEAFPHFHLDYREKLTNDPEERWNYRITQDGTWEGNLYNFYYRVYNRLIQDVEVPFALDKEGVRIGETHVHEAIREVLANTLIHADQKTSKSIVIVKEREAMTFRNPGRLRITIAQLYQGGVTDPRNPYIQKMFQFLGLGEKAGSGFEKILRAWKEQEWFRPLVYEKYDSDLTFVVLPMLSMVPEHINSELLQVIGDEYHATDELQRLILILAHQFAPISNSEITAYSTKHPRDVGEELQQMIKKGWLVSEGKGRGMKYRLKRNTSEGGQAGGQAEIQGGQAEGQAEATPDITMYDWHLIQALSTGDKSAKELKTLQTNSSNISGAFKERITQLIENGLIAFTIPDKPKSPNQKYRLTELGKKILRER
ncbi:MAG: transcriptional regulator [Sulfurovum sp.]|nr:MAG: transcriptional regulator [Sulfurovum sp.]